jgi:transposase
MAPHLAKSQVALITGMLSSGLFTNSEIAIAANCSTRGVRRIRSNVRYYGAPQAPRNGGGRKRSITPAMLDALCEHLLEKPGMYQSEMILFLLDEFDVLITASSIGRALRSRGWTKKQIRRIANGRNADLRDYYLYQISSLSPEHFVFVDESGCDKRIGFRRTGWSPIGTTPLQIARFQREQRYQTLPAYTIDRVIFSQIFQGTTDSEVFEDFIEQLLPLCGRWPEPQSVLVMDNASIHHTDRITQICADAGVKLVYLPPYSPDLNPIEEFFAELKAFIKRNWQVYEVNPSQGFDHFLNWCIDVVGKREQSAQGHFRHAGLRMEEL